MHKLAVLDRRAFLDWIVEPTHVPNLMSCTLGDINHSVRGKHIGLVWRYADNLDDSTNPTIVVPESELHDFLAWAATYVSSYSPFTAFFRVFTTDEINFSGGSFGKSKLYSGKFLSALSGVVIAEAVVQLPQSPRSLAAVSLQACQATFSYAALKALASGFHPDDLPALASAWTRARNIASDVPLRLGSESSNNFWVILSSTLIANPDWQIRQDGWMSALSELIHAEQFGKSLRNSSALRLLRSIVPFADPIEGLFDLPREEQLVVLDRTCRALSSSELPRPLAEAWVGLLAARLANGSFDYIGVLDSVRDSFPASLLWFALFSIWRPGFDGLVNGRCLGRRISKEALKISDPFDAPSADISLAEYEVLSLTKSLSGIRTKTSSVIDIELLRSISSKFRMPSKSREEAPPGRSNSLNQVALRRALEEALRTLEPEQSPDAKIQDAPAPSLFSKRALYSKAPRGKKK